MPKQRRSDSDERGGGRKATRRPTRRPRRRRRRHLYLVLDDWSLGYSIRKIDLSAYGCYAGLQPVPRPMFQLEGPSALHVSMYFAASSSGSSKIMAMHPQLKDARCFDVRSRSLVYGPRPADDHEVPHPWNTRHVCPVFIPVGDRLCALWGRSLQLLERPPPPPQEEEEESGGAYLWSWRELHEELPFDSSCVTSYAVHPDGRSVFVTFKKKHFGRWHGGGPDSEPTQDTTLCLDVDESTDRALRLRGEFDWALPFEGSSYFVGELNAWVGLSESYGSIGHLRACSVVTPGSTSSSSSSTPSWKTSKEGLLTNNLAETYMGATLVYLGTGSEFCLVECVSVGYSYVYEGLLKTQPFFDLLWQYKNKEHHPLLRLTTFSLAVDENGDLTTGNTRRLHYYSLPESVTRPWPYMQHPVAFWL